MTCDAVRERFSDLMDGELDEAVRPRVEEHLTSCGSCRLEWAKFRQTVDAVRGMPQLSSPVGFTDDIRQRLERAELLDRGEAPKPSRAGWKRPLMLFSAAAVVLVVARVGLQSRNQAPMPDYGVTPHGKAGTVGNPNGSLETLADVGAPAPEMAWEPVPDSLEPGQGGGGDVPEPQSKAWDEVKDLQAHAAHDEPATATEGNVLRLQAGLENAAPPVAPAAPPPPAAAVGRIAGPPVIALAWVMPCADAEAGERRIREAFVPQTDRKSGGSLEEPGTRRRGVPARQAAPDDGIVRKAHRLLTLKVRVSELQETTRRLEALGARPAPERDEAVLFSERAGEKPSGEPEALVSDAREPDDVETRAASARGFGALAEKAKDADKAEALRKGEDNEQSFGTPRKEPEEAAAPEEAWITLTVVLEPLPEAPPPAETP